MSRDTKKLVIEMSVCIGLYGICSLIAAAIWFRSPAVFLGLVIGLAGALAMLVNMAFSLEHSMALGEHGGAAAYARKMYFVRFAIMVLVFVLIYFVKAVNIFAVIIGALGLKAAAYMQPVLHKTFTRGEV